MTKRKAPDPEPTFEAYQRVTIVVTIDMETPRLTTRHLVEEAINAELSKKKHNMGAVRVHAYKADEVATAALRFAEVIHGAARDAVDERIR